MLGVGVGLGITGGQKRWNPIGLYGSALAGYYDHAASRVTVDGSNLIAQTNDQSPLALHATQSTGVAKPTWVASDQDFADQPVLKYPTDAVPRWVDTPSFTLESQPETVILVACSDLLAASTVGAWLIDNANGSMMALYKSSSTWLQAAGGTFYDTTWGGSFASNKEAMWPEVHIFVAQWNGTSSRLWVDGVPTAAAGDAGTQGRNQLRIGCRGSGASGWQGRIGPVIRVKRLLTAAEIARDTHALATRCLPRQLLFDGDSRMADDGGHVTVGSAWPTLIRANRLSGQPVRLQNFAVSGATTADIATRAATKKLIVNSLRPTNDVILMGGINSLLPPSDLSAADTYASIKSAADAYAANGHRVFICTEIPFKCAASYEAKRLALNVLIKASGYRVIDFAARPEWASQSLDGGLNYLPVHTELYSDAGTVCQHPNETGQGYLSSVGGAALQAA